MYDLTPSNGLKSKVAFGIVSGSLQVLSVMLPQMWERYANSHISTLGLKLILHSSQENKRESTVQKLFWTWSYASPSARREGASLALLSRLGVFSGFSIICTLPARLSLRLSFLFLLAFSLFPSLETSSLFQSKKGPTDKTWQCFILC